MNLTPEQETLGRRNFLKALAGTPALAALGVAAATRGPIRGGPVKVAWIGVGNQGRALLGRMDPTFTTVKAFCDINPVSLAKADELLAKGGQPPAKHYTDWKDMLAKEDIEGVVMAPPLWMHADLAVGCMEAGKHVLCEKMMAWDVPSCQRMMDAAHKTGKVLEIGYQRNYNPVYQAAQEGIIKAGVLGEVYHARLAWHRNGNWRRPVDPAIPGKDFDPSPWGYPDPDHLINWRLYWRYSKGLLAELASHQVNITNWFFGAEPEYVQGYGGVFRFKDGREVQDHVYTTFEYPDGRTAVFSAIESNAFDNYYEMFMGTKGTLILRAETDAMLFPEAGAGTPTAVEVARKGGPDLDASESKPATQTSTAVGATGENAERGAASRNEIARWAAAIRTGAPLLCGPERAIGSARACIVANEAVQKNERVKV